MEKILKTLFLITIFTSAWIGFSYNVSNAEQLEVLIEKLVDKNVLTQSDADLILNSKSKQKSSDLRLYWKNGIRIDSENKDVKLKVGGRIMNDWAFMTQDSSTKNIFGELQDQTTEIRSARLFLSGTLYNKIIFKAQYEFADEDVDIKDMYIGIKNISGIGTLKIGHFYEPFGLEQLTSRKFIAFMERGLSSAFVPGRNTGILFNNANDDKRITWSAGIFMDTNSYGNDDNAESNFATTARITGVPWIDGKDKLLHLGFSCSYRDSKDDISRFSSSPSAHLAFNFVDTGDITADSEMRFGIETALIYESFSFQTEYVGTKVNAKGNMSDPYFSGYYVYISYFLTDDNRPYDRSKGVFSRIKPKEIVGKDDGKGAWEIALRYSAIDLEDDEIYGGEMSETTLGLNWYLNAKTRIMANYIHADWDNSAPLLLVDDTGDADIVQMRFQIDI